MAPPGFGLLRHRKEFILREPVSLKGHGRFVPVQTRKNCGEWRYRTTSTLDGDAWLFWSHGCFAQGERSLERIQWDDRWLV